MELPNRLTEGYGLTEEMICRFRERGVRLLFAIDAGITATAAVALAASAGIDVVILDHHALPEALPKAHAILHPALAGFPGAHPCAAGVTHLFVRECEEFFPEPMSETERMHLTALAAIGTVADLVPLTGWNRALVREGIDALRTLRTGPLAAFVQAVQVRGEALTARDIAFRIAPRINAAGRMEDPSIALAALLGSPSALHALHAMNSARQELSADLTEQAIAMIDGQPKSPFLVLAHEEFTAGVMGLVAGKLVERFGRPALVASVFGEQCRASLRGVPGYDVTAALRSGAHLLTNFGGHAQAAGCTFPRAHTDALRTILSSHVLENIPEEELQPSVRIDAALEKDDLSLSLAQALDALEPFGQGNPEPRFLLEGATIDSARCVGAAGNHLHCRIGAASGIGFRLGHLLEHAAEPLDIVFRLTVDTWNGLRRAKAVIEDLRIHARDHASVSYDAQC